ncbi:MAG: hypothetical protein AB4372_09455 [Xenococcus sp. (in: cyanobacteria)]
MLRNPNGNNPTYITIPDLEPPIFELTKASKKSDEDVKISLNEQEKKVAE